LDNLGLPLTIEVHDKAHDSYMTKSSSNDIALRGMANLFVLLLFSYHSRQVIESLEQRNVVIVELLRNFWSAGYLWDIHNYGTLLATLGCFVFSPLAFALEKLYATKGVSRCIVSC
jgi:hypothetical protein